MEQLIGSKLGNDYFKTVYCHLVYLIYMQSTSCKMPGWMTHSWNQDCWEKCQQPQVLTTSGDSILPAQNEEGLKSLLMIVKEKSEKPGLKLNIPKTKIMVSSSITSWQIGREKVESNRFYFLCFKITADGGCSHEMKRCLLLGRKTMTNLDNVLKCRDITLPTKVYIVKAMVFPAVRYECESWTKRSLSAKELMFYNCGVRKDS